MSEQVERLMTEQVMTFAIEVAAAAKLAGWSLVGSELNPATERPPWLDFTEDGAAYGVTQLRVELLSCAGGVEDGKYALVLNPLGPTMGIWLDNVDAQQLSDVLALPLAEIAADLTGYLLKHG